MQFCTFLNAALDDHTVVCMYTSSTDDAKRANAIHLICCWQLLYLQRTPEQAYAGFASSDTPDRQPSHNCSRRPSNRSSSYCPLPPFHDASNRDDDYDLSVLDCLHGLAAALRHGFFDTAAFDLEEYETMEAIEVCTCRTNANECNETWMLYFSHHHTYTYTYTERRHELDSSRSDSGVCWSHSGAQDGSEWFGNKCTVGLSPLLSTTQRGFGCSSQ